MTIDEIMSFWFGLNSEFAVDALPHQTKIKRKPRGVGAEAKAICDGQSGVMLRLDFMEGQERQHQKQYFAEYGEGTAVAMRLSQPWAGSGRYTVMDSAFGSVKSCVALYNVLGLFCIGMVKTASRLYPKKWYSDWHREGSVRGADGRRLHQPGAWKTLQSSFETWDQGVRKKIFAVGWHEIKLKTIISTMGTTVRGNDAIKSRHKKVWINGREQTERYERAVPQPSIIEIFFAIFGKVDQHDHF